MVLIVIIASDELKTLKSKFINCQGPKAIYIKKFKKCNLVVTLNII